MGEPDLIFWATDEFLVKANDDYIPYQGFVFDTSALTEDHWIQAWEIRPRERAAVHHANLAMSPRPFNKALAGGILSQAATPGGDYIGSYIPGARPMVYPEGTAYLLPKGANMAIQVHYVGLEKDVLDRIAFGVKFAQGRVDKRVRVIGLIGVDGDIDIAPHQSDYKLGADLKLLYDTLLFSSGAHMHLRGKAYTMWNVLEDASHRLNTDVPDYDYNWQSNYWLADPIFAPKGSYVRTLARYDKSKSNPRVPNPEVRVKHGPWTDDEMLNSWSHGVVAHEKLGLDLVVGRVVGKVPDAQAEPHPLILQGLNARKLTQDGQVVETSMLPGAGAALGEKQ
jgi:hypothetical protein